MDRRHFLRAGVALAALGGKAVAQNYPDRPIRIVQGYASGGNADTIARLIGAELGNALGKPVIVETMTGAGGTIASAAVARAKPDGYTLLLTTAGHTVAGAMLAKPPYRVVDDFEMVSTITFFPFLLVTAANSTYTSLPQLLAAARSAPGTVSYGSAGIGTTHHLAGELLGKMASAPMLHVAYRGDAASLTGLLAGDVAFVIAPPTAVVAQIQAGKVRAIATSASHRWAGLPDVPTVAESGVPGYDVQSWAGLMAPAGTPAAIVQRLNAQVVAALQAPHIREKLAAMGGEARASTPRQMRAMVSADLDKWTRVVADANLERQ